jgi:hypothetical protein
VPNRSAVQLSDEHSQRATPPVFQYCNICIAILQYLGFAFGATATDEHDLHGTGGRSVETAKLATFLRTRPPVVESEKAALHWSLHLVNLDYHNGTREAGRPRRDATALRCLPLQLCGGAMRSIARTPTRVKALDLCRDNIARFLEDHAETEGDIIRRQQWASDQLPSTRQTNADDQRQNYQLGPMRARARENSRRSRPRKPHRT